jgi:hypothetical protein
MQGQHSIDARSTSTNSAPDSSSTQRERIFNLLVCAQGDWVPLLEIAACAPQYNARIFELRRFGFRIENRTKEINGVRHSWFRFASSPARARSSTPPAAQRVVSIDSQMKSSGEVSSLPQQGTLPLFRTGDR